MNASFRAARMSRSLLARLAVVMMVATGLTGLSSLAAARPRTPRSPAATGSRAVSIAATRKGAPYVVGRRRAPPASTAPA